VRRAWLAGRHPTIQPKALHPVTVVSVAKTWWTRISTELTLFKNMLLVIDGAHMLFDLFLIAFYKDSRTRSLWIQVIAARVSNICSILQDEAPHLHLVADFLPNLVTVYCIAPA
jgi:hypothetical protein